MANILILYYYHQYPVRATHLDHLYCFAEYSSHRCFYLNVATQRIPTYVKRFRWDLIIIHTLLLSTRFTRELFVKNIKKVHFLKDSEAVKIALPQDEFINMDLVCNFIKEFGVSHVFSVSPESEWSVIYRTLDPQQITLHKVLTGYIGESLTTKIGKLSQSMPTERPIDIGYRAYRAAFWLGRHGVLKRSIADIFQEKAPQKSLVADISTRFEDTIPGDDWYRFLLRCKYQIGVEGGASIFDWDGTYRKRAEDYLIQNPDAKFEEVESACFPGMDGSLKYFAISPRHLECCVTKTCQVLVEGNYSGVLLPGKHYIELKRDFSNLDEILNIIAKDELRDDMTAAAWQDVVESRKYTYRGFVDYLIANSLSGFPPRSISIYSAIVQLIIYYWMLIQDRVSWLLLTFEFALWNRIRHFTPQLLVARLRGLFIR